MSDQVTRERFLPADRDDVWRALTERDGLESWLAEEAEIELEPGGELRFRLGDGQERAGFVEEVSAPERLSFWWRDPARRDEPLTRVELTLTDAEGGTVVRVAETREPATVEAVLLPATRVEHSTGPEMRASAGFALVS